MVRKCGWRSELSSSPPSVLPPTPPARHSTSSSSSSYQRKSSRWTFYDATQLTSVYIHSYTSINIITNSPFKKKNILYHFRWLLRNNCFPLELFTVTSFSIAICFIQTFHLEVVHLSCRVTFRKEYWRHFPASSFKVTFTIFLRVTHAYRCIRNRRLKRPSSARSFIASTAKKDANGTVNCAN